MQGEDSSWKFFIRFYSVLKLEPHRLSSVQTENQTELTFPNRTETTFAHPTKDDGEQLSTKSGGWLLALLINWLIFFFYSHFRFNLPSLDTVGCHLKWRT